MYSRPIVKDDFEVPKELVTKNFILNPLTVKHLNSDYEAVMKSENHEIARFFMILCSNLRNFCSPSARGSARRRKVFQK